jgi:hypothetical protein
VTKLVVIMGTLMVVNVAVLVTSFRHEPAEPAPTVASHAPETAKASHEEAAAQPSAHNEPHAGDAHAGDAHEAAKPEPAAESVVQDPDYKTPFFTGYRPPLMGKCKVLFRKFKDEPLESGRYKAFAYSYDGEFVACASTVSEQNQQAADRVAIDECESNRRSAVESARCRIYAIE